ncbi:MAG: hypothetical protein AAGD25_02440 [Cyanobacteria bacterium P01_F01_bin.150]
MNKKALLKITIFITSLAAVISIYLATLEKPTSIQDRLSTTTNAIAIAGATAIFGLLDDDQDDSRPV